MKIETHRLYLSRADDPVVVDAGIELPEKDLLATLEIEDDPETSTHVIEQIRKIVAQYLVYETWASWYAQGPTPADEIQRAKAANTHVGNLLDAIDKLGPRTVDAIDDFGWFKELPERPTLDQVKSTLLGLRASLENIGTYLPVKLGKPSNEPLNTAVERLANLYTKFTERKPTRASKSHSKSGPINELPTVGPFFKFCRQCFGGVPTLDDRAIEAAIDYMIRAEKGPKVTTITPRF